MNGRLAKGGHLEEVGRDNVFLSKTNAIKATCDRLDRDRCRACDKLIFRECATMQGPTDALRICEEPVL